MKWWLKATKRTSSWALDFGSQGQDWALSLSFIIWFYYSCAYLSIRKAHVPFLHPPCVCSHLAASLRLHRLSVYSGMASMAMLDCWNKTCLCSAVDRQASVNQSSCLLHHWGPDVYISIFRAQRKPGTTCRICRCVATSLQHSNSLQEREAHCGQSWVIFNTQSGQNTTNHPLLTLALSLAGATPVIRLTRWGWLVKWGCARQCSTLWSTTDSCFKCLSLLDWLTQCWTLRLRWLTQRLCSSVKCANMRFVRLSYWRQACLVKL